MKDDESNSELSIKLQPTYLFWQSKIYEWASTISRLEIWMNTTAVSFHIDKRNI
jgi:hypothetical protein